MHVSHLCNDDAPFAIGLQVPGCQWEYESATGDDDRWCVWFLDPGSRSWARFGYQPDSRRWPVHQFGPRRLFDEVSAAYHQWDHAGRPPATHWRFTITPDGQRVQLTSTPDEQASTHTHGHDDRAAARRRSTGIRGHDL